MTEPTPWSDIDHVKHITLQTLASSQDPELSSAHSVAIVESLCRNPSNPAILRFLAHSPSGHLFARAIPTYDGALPATEEAWHGIC